MLSMGGAGTGWASNWLRSSSDVTPSVDWFVGRDNGVVFSPPLVHVALVYSMVHPGLEQGSEMVVHLYALFGLVLLIHCGWRLE